MADPNSNMIQQHVPIDCPALNSTITLSFPHIDEDSVINIQLPYDFNRLTEPDLWDGNFYSVSLYGSLEHLTSNADSIRKSMVCMATYIKIKKIKISKSNNIKDFEGIGKVAWKLISFIYEAGWDSLVADNHKNTFRQKISHKFTSQVNLEKPGKKQETPANKLTSIERLLSLILAKSPKEVNEILKYFKTSKPFMTVLNQAKSYAQSAKNVSNTEKVLKIKAANIKNIQKIIKGNNNSKPKPHINITTKGPSHKQVIVPMSNINQKNFMKESGAHVTNLNKALENLKLEVTVNFVRSNASGIIVVTNKVTNSLDL